MERYVQKTSTILVGIGVENRWYRSLAEVPPPVRKQLEECTSGPRSATLLIADENGRRELLRTLDGAAPSLESKLVQSMMKRKSAQKALPLRFWSEILFVAGIGVCLYLLAAWK